MEHEDSDGYCECKFADTNGRDLVSDEVYLGSIAFAICATMAMVGAWIMGPFGAFLGVGVFTLLLLSFFKWLDQNT